MKSIRTILALLLIACMLFVVGCSSTKPAATPQEPATETVETITDETTEEGTEEAAEETTEETTEETAAE